MYITLFSTDIIQLGHTMFNQRIFNNTVINLLGEAGGGGGITTLPPPESKRGSPVQDSLYIDCTASQGNHRPLWATSNMFVGQGIMFVPRVGDGYGAERLSPYVARLSFDFFVPEYQGVFTCISELSGKFVEIIITDGRH